MFTPFFYLLRARGLRVSMSEWLVLMQALDKGLAGSSLTQFYHLARALLVGSEADYDRYDGAFLEYFRDSGESGALPPALLEALEAVGQSVEKRDALQGEIDQDEVRAQFDELLAEQEDAHRGGHHWIGTEGTSPFGNRGYGAGGVRFGGQSERQSAFTVAGERRYRDFREDNTLDERRFQSALRSLRQLSTLTDAPKSELNLQESIRATANNAGRLQLAFERPRKNAVKLLLLIDSGGSMDPYASLCAALFRAASSSSHFRDLRIYYFHNCVREFLYASPRILREERTPTEGVLQSLDGAYRVIFVGDALMDLSELTGGDAPTGLDILRKLRAKFPHMVWLTPQRTRPQTFNHWGDSFFLIEREVGLYRLTIEGLSAAFKKLMVSR